MLLGITGTDGSGKGTVVDYLVKEKSFKHYSARAIIVREIEARGLSINREQMRLVANDLRALHGDDVIVTTALALAKKEGITNIVVESIRTVAEAETLQRAGGILVAVDALVHVRYQRIVGRGSHSDAISFDQFVAHEKLESNDPDPHGMQKAKVIASAEHIITNNSDLAELKSQIDAFLDKNTG